LHADREALTAGGADRDDLARRRAKLRDKWALHGEGAHHLPPAGGSDARNIATCWSNIYDDAFTAVAPSAVATRTTTSSPPSPRRETCVGPSCSGNAE